MRQVCIRHLYVNIRRRRAPASRAKKLLGLLQRRHQGVDFLMGVVEVETGAGGGRRAELFVQRHGAMVTGPNRNAFLIEKRGQVVRMNVAETE
jgi:hypothetical protein